MNDPFRIEPIIPKYEIISDYQSQDRRDRFKKVMDPELTPEDLKAMGPFADFVGLRAKPKIEPMIEPKIEPKRIESMFESDSLLGEQLTEAQMERRLGVVLGLPLESFSNQELAAFHLAATGWGEVNEGNCSYKPALEAGLIHEDGSIVALTNTVGAIADEVCKG